MGVNCKIQVGEALSIISGEYPLEEVMEATSYFVDGHQFSQKFKRGYWDGKKHLFNKRLQSFPSGLVKDVVTALKEADPTAKIEVKWGGNKIPPPRGNGFTLHGIDFGKGKYNYQLKCAKEMIRQKRGVIKLATNAGKSEIAIAVTKAIGRSTLFIVQRKELLHQTRKRFALRLNLPIEEIGVVGDQLCEIKDITIASPESYMNRIQDGTAPLNWTVLFMDECHRAGAETYYNVVSAINAPYRFGMSGTPLDRTDGADLRLLAMTGPILYEIRNKFLVERGVSVVPHVHFIPIREPKVLKEKGKKLTYQDVEKKGVIENPHLNNHVVAQAVKHATEGRQVLVLLEKTGHGKRLLELLSARRAPPHAFISGKESTNTRESVLEDFKENNIQILIATPILDEGVDVPNIDVIILAGAGKSKIKLLQRIGRGLRLKPGKEKLQVIDFANFTHKWLINHSWKRLQMYKEEDCFVITGI